MKVDRIEKCCEFCGEKFSITPGAERKRIKQFGVGAKFCSPKCMGAYKSSQFDHPPVNRKCEYCGTDFTVEKPCKKNRFCSKECFYEVTKEENDKERTRIIPLMKEYRLTHTVAETAEKFGMSPSGVQQWGVLGPEAEKRASLPDQLTAEQDEALIGNLLGDGYLKYLKPNTDQNSCLSIRQKLEFSEYLKGLYEIYSPFSCGYTEAKRQTLKTILKEYGQVVNFFIEQFWINTPTKAELLKDIVNLPDTWLSARLRKVAAREAIDSGQGSGEDN